jgi:hypothetical protein
MPVIRADGAQRGNFAAPRGIREQARSYPIQATPVNGYFLHFPGRQTRAAFSYLERGYENVQR